MQMWGNPGGWGLQEPVLPSMSGRIDLTGLEDLASGSNQSTFRYAFGYAAKIQ